MDIFGEALVKGVPLVMVVIGLVTWLGKLGITGKAQLVSALLVGLILGIGYQLSLEIPVDFAGWFGAVIYGLGLGIVASGIYETGLEIAKKAGVG